MSIVTLELTDTSGNSTAIDESPISNSIATSAINLDSDDATDYENSQQRIFPQSKQRIHPNRPYSVVHKYISIIRLVLDSIIPDLRSFKYWQILILVLFATFNVVFSVLDFNSFFPRDEPLSLLKWNNDLRAGKPLWQRILLCLSGVAAFTNVLNVVLVIRGKISSYFWGIIAAIIYGVFSFAYGYVGDAQLYVMFFLPMQFVGVYMWAKELDSQSTTRVKSLSLIGWILVIILSAALAVMFFYEIPAFSKLLTKMYAFDLFLVPHILDATTNAMSVVAQFLLIFCYWEQYVLWTLVNLMAIAMYSGLLQTDLELNLLLVWIMLAINSLVGLYTWFRRWKSSQHPEPHEPDLDFKI